jgi:hypothetical protein
MFFPRPATGAAPNSALVTDLTGQARPQSAYSRAWKIDVRRVFFIIRGG